MHFYKMQSLLNIGSTHCNEKIYTAHIWNKFRNDKKPFFKQKLIPSILNFCWHLEKIEQ